MAHVQNTPEDVRTMLKTIGVKSVDDLFSPIPPALRFNRKLNVPGCGSEAEILNRLKEFSGKNKSADDYDCYLGGGYYDHYIPAIVDSLSSRGEFLTSYTPYQPEVSQGNLQAMFEFQTMICELTGMEIANSSVYDGSTAFVEAILMGLRLSKNRTKVVVSSAVHPHYRQTLKTYLTNLDATLVEVPFTDGRTDLKAMTAAVDDKTAVVGVANPNFFGCVENLQEMSALIHGKGAMMVVSVDPIAQAILKTPGEAGADIATGEGQPLGGPLCYGGPSFGFFAARMEHSRQMPGRVVGETVDRDGKRGFVLTLQTREQHIRREKATSNICTNSGLMALRGVIYMSTVGAQGLKAVAEASVKKAHYLADRIAKVKGYKLKFSAPFAREFAVETPKPAAQVAEALLAHGILAGLPLAGWYPGMDNVLLVAVTEKRGFQALDRFADALAKV